MKAFPNTEANLEAARVITLKEAVETTWASDAHLLLYVPEKSEKSPRILKDYFRTYSEKLQVEVLFADCDNGGHKAWVKEDLEAHIKDISESNKLDDLGIYYTKNGFRVFQTLKDPFVISSTEIAERHILKWFKDLEKRGFDVDYNCRDVTHLFRLPNVRRDGKDYRSPYIDMSRMSHLVIDVLDLGSEDEEIEPPSHRVQSLYNIPEWANDLPAEYDIISKKIATELLRIQSAWHPIYLGIAGALNSRGVPVEKLPLVCRQIALHARDTKPEDRFAIGKSTATKRHNGQPTRGITYLYARYPELARTIDVAFGIIKEEQFTPGSNGIDLVYANIKELMHNAEPGITVIQVDVGVGKTNAALEVAIERADQGLKSSISVDKNILAKQIQDDISKKDHDSNRKFGSLSMKDALGNPVCIHHEIATNLAEGGQSISYELCNGRNETKCIMFENCEARKGFEGSEDSDIMVSNHSMLSQLNEHAGKKGTLVIDEPRAFTTTYKITKKDRELLAKRMDNFEFRYIMHAKDYLNRIISWEDQELSFTDLTLDVDLSEITNMETRHKRGVPPIKREFLQMLRKAKEASEEIGKVSKLIYILYRAKTERSIVILNEDVIEITMYDEDMRNALLRDGTVIITDANADLFLDQIEAMTGNKPEFYQHSTGDNAYMERSIIKKKGANRSNWILYGNPVPRNGLEDALKHITEWHVPGNTIGIITFFPIEKAIREKKDWVPKELLDMNPMLAHYYNIRGLNNFMELQELVTIGDPWKNRGIIEHEMKFHGITANKEMHELKVCQAELYQSHGRLRPTRRKKPGRSLHIGNVTPGGFGWANATIYRPRSGASIISARKIAEIMKIKNLTQRQLATIIELDQSQLSKILSGKLNISYEAAAKLRAII